LEEAIQVTKIRNEADAQRYEKLYDVNFSDTSQFNLVVDTTNLTIEQTTEQVIEAFKEYQKSRN